MKNVILGMWAFLLTLVLPQPALAAGLNGADLSICWVLPFAGILLCIAICPLAVPHFWHGNYGKVAVFWALATAVHGGGRYPYPQQLYRHAAYQHLFFGAWRSACQHYGHNGCGNALNPSSYCG